MIGEYNEKWVSKLSRRATQGRRQTLGGMFGRKGALRNVEVAVDEED